MFGGVATPVQNQLRTLEMCIGSAFTHGSTFSALKVILNTAKFVGPLVPRIGSSHSAQNDVLRHHG